MKKQYDKPELKLMALMQTDVLFGSGDPTDMDWIVDVPGTGNGGEQV